MVARHRRTLVVGGLRDTLREFTIAGTTYTHSHMDYVIEFEQEDDGRWIAEIPSLPGVMVYGATRSEAEWKVQALALRVTADRLEQQKAATDHVAFAAA